MRLIDADRLINILEPTRACFLTDGEGAIKLISDAPTIDLEQAAEAKGYRRVKIKERKTATYDKCRDCIYLTGHKSSIGVECTNPQKEFATYTAGYKYPHNKACKKFVKKG